MEPLGSKPAFGSPMPAPTWQERRRRVRMKVHTPAYAVMNGNPTSAVRDLSAILDISEDGMCLQAATPLQAGRHVALYLDLSESESHIPTSAEVIWAGRLGRAGIRFAQLPFGSARRLKEWLFLNAMTACLNQTATPLRPTLSCEETISPVASVKEELESSVPPDYTSILAGLAAVKREVESLGGNLDVALQLVVERAQSFTHATGAAIALADSAEMVCRATAGPDAPPLGARLQVGSGFSGECVRSGILLRCEDAETDSRVDRESCRALGIRSMIAVPIRVGGSVAGLLEVFAPQANAFNRNADTILQRLEETIVAAVNRAARAAVAQKRALEAQAQPAADTGDPEMMAAATAADRPTLGPFRKILLGIVALTLLLVVVWLMAPWGGGVLPGERATAPRKTSPAAAAGPKVTVADVSNLEGLRKLAEQGDPAAQFAVGARYATGEEVKQDYAEAVRWFNQAAEQGHVNAQAMLGAYYGVGRGVPQDLGKAYFWSVLAQAGGDEASKYRIPLLVSHMSRAQVIAAQQQANEWLTRHRPGGKPNAEVR